MTATPACFAAAGAWLLVVARTLLLALAVAALLTRVHESTTWESAYDIMAVQLGDAGARICSNRHGSRTSSPRINRRTTESPLRSPRSGPSSEHEATEPAP